MMPERSDKEAPEPLPLNGSVKELPAWHATPTRSTWLFLEALQKAAWDGEGTWAKIDDGNYTYLGALHTHAGTQKVVLKRFAHRKGLIGRIRAFFHGTQARKQTEGARLVWDLGVPTSAPIVLYRGRHDSRRYDWLAMLHLPGKDVLHHLADDDLSVKDQHDLARRVGGLVRTFDRNALLNRDLKLSNIVRTPDGQLGVVDTVGVREHRRNPLRMLRDMMYEATGTNVLPRRTLLFQCLREAVDDPKEAWRELQRMHEQGGDRTPRVDPLR